MELDGKMDALLMTTWKVEIVGCCGVSLGRMLVGVETQRQRFPAQKQTRHE